VDSKSQSPKTQQKNKQSTLNFVEVSEIRDGVLVLRSSEMRAVMAVSSANFALKSGEEQQIIINNFQGILNSLEFPIQILVQSRKLNLDPYIEKLRQLEDKQQNDLLRIKMQEYVEYIKQMLNQINIMKKDFYIVIGYEPNEAKAGFFTSFLRSINPTQVIKMNRESFLRNRKVLMQRAEQVLSRFSSLDLKSDILTTEQLIALMYNSYNPDTLESVRLKDVADLDIENF
jgi:hypothetical protein